MEALIVAAMAGGSVIEGVSAYNQGKAQDEMYSDQAKVAEQEAVREARRKQLEFRRFNAQKKLNYLARGVTLSGTPMSILASDVKLQDEELKAVTDSGAARSRYLQQVGANKRAEGRSKLIGSLFDAGLAIGNYATSNKPGTTTTDSTIGLDAGGRSPWGQPMPAPSYGDPWKPMRMW